MERQSLSSSSVHQTFVSMMYLMTRTESMNTTSAWKTKTLTEEIEEYKEEVKREAIKLTSLSGTLYSFLNEP